MKDNHLGMDVGQANELKLAFRRYDWSNSLIKRLCDKDVDVLGDALDILRGDAVAVPVKRVINLSADPVLETGHSVVKHLKQGKRPWSEIRLSVMCPDDLQYTFRRIPHEAIRQGMTPMDSLNPRNMMPWYMKGQRPANICMRDYLLANQHLISGDWWMYGGRPLLFWGTIFHNGSCLCVPGMDRYSGKWEAYDRRVDQVSNEGHSRLTHFRYDNPCVVLV